MFKLQSSPPVLGAEEDIVVRELVWVCNLQSRAGTSPHGDQQHPAFSWCCLPQLPEEL